MAIGAARGTGWREADLLVLDFEATSAEPRSARPLSVGWVGVGGGRVRATECGYAVVRHVDPVPAGALAVHGLTPDVVAAGRPPEEVRDEIAQGMALRKMPTDADVAEAAVFFASDRSSMITGQRLLVNAGEFYDT